MADPEDVEGSPGDQIGRGTSTPCGLVATQTSLLHLETAGRVTFASTGMPKVPGSCPPYGTSDKVRGLCVAQESCAQCFSMATRERQEKDTSADSEAMIGFVWPARNGTASDTATAAAGSDGTGSGTEAFSFI